MVSCASDKKYVANSDLPRSSLPSEALEEFLSILRPSAFFPSSSPILRTRRNGATLPHFPYPFKARVLHSRGDSINFVEEMDRSRFNAPTKSPELMIEREEITMGDHERYDSDTLAWLATTALCKSPHVFRLARF